MKSPLTIHGMVLRGRLGGAAREEDDHPAERRYQGKDEQPLDDDDCEDHSRGDECGQQQKK